MPVDPSLAEALGAALGAPVTALARLGGGDFATSYRATLADGRAVFAKTHRSPPPGFCSREAADLEWLQAAGAVGVPEVLAVGDGDPAFLALRWVAAGGRPDEARFGRELAALHRAGAPAFGRADRRTTGSLALPNEPCATWAEFFATQRLGPLIRLAADGAHLPEQVVRDLARVLDRLVLLGVPEEPPARLHGDLWAGNRLVDRSGRSWLIDPAAHGGHREFDVAMMRLFGGFGEECVVAYAEAFPLADGWERRIPLHQLAPLVVHAIKFGGGYVGATARAAAAVLSY